MDRSRTSNEQRLSAEALAKAEATSNAPLRWVFLDVGNVLLNDDPCMVLMYRILHDLIRADGHELTLGQLLAEREQLINEQDDWRAHWTLARRYIGEPGRKRMHDIFHRRMEEEFLTHNLEMAGIRDVLACLSRDYRLGVASNHGPGCRPALERSGLIDYFDLIGISVEMGVAKPDPAFFGAILSEAGCGPEEAAMVGDRIDNDIVPAKALGMHTVWLKLDLREKGYDPLDERDRLCFQSRLRANVSRVGPRGPHEEPDATVTGIAELPAAIASLDEAPGGR